MAGSLRLGLIGAGRWGRVFIKVVRQTEGLKLAAVASGNPETKALVPSDCQIFADWREMLDPKIIDGLIVASPPATHFSITSLAIERGIPVLVEKPLTMNLAEAEALQDLVVKEGALVMVDHIHLFSPAFRKLKELVATAGPISSIEGIAGNHGPFRKDASVLWDWSPHDVAMVLALMGGKPTKIEAEAIKDEGPGETIRLGLTYPGGVSALIVNSNTLAEKVRRMTVKTGTDVLVYDDLAENKLTRNGLAEPLDPTPPLTLALSEFSQAIRSQAKGGLELAVDVVGVLTEVEKEINQDA